MGKVIIVMGLLLCLCGVVYAETYTYWVLYKFTVKPPIGNFFYTKVQGEATCFSYCNYKIQTEEDVRLLQKSLERDRPQYEEIVVLNWKKLKYVK